MKLAIAGCGRIASVHYEAIEQLIQDKNYNVSISALIDISEINAKHFQQKHQIDSKIFTDFEDALNQVEFDSVLICAPHDFHETLAIMSFENGKHVLFRKADGPRPQLCFEDPQAFQAFRECIHDCRKQPILAGSQLCP